MAHGHGLIRMDSQDPGHTTLAEWTAADEASVEAAVTAFRAQLDAGLYAVVTEGEGHARAGRRAAARRRARDPPAPDRRRVSAGALPETAAVHWRPRVDERGLAPPRAGCGRSRTVAHTVPFLAAAARAVRAPAAVGSARPSILLAHAWAIPELYAKRGATVRPAASARRRRAGARPRSACSAT